MIPVTLAVLVLDTVLTLIEFIEGEIIGANR
jgi:hypothetical protein